MVAYVIAAVYPKQSYDLRVRKLDQRYNYCLHRLTGYILKMLRLDGLHGSVIVEEAKDCFMPQISAEYITESLMAMLMVAVPYVNLWIARYLCDDPRV